MIDYIKTRLLEDPEKIKQYLEYFDFHHIVIRTNYISFGRNIDSSPKSIVIRRTNNEALLVKDYPKNLVCDLFNYVIKEKGISFKEAISEAKSILGINGWHYKEQRHTAPFGGFYSNIRSKKDVQLNVYDESILDKYVSCGNERFLKDNISLKAQRYFNIGYSVEEQCITIPIYSEVGMVIGVKARINRDPKESEQKYYYLIPCLMSQTLYGYSQNYEYLESSDVVYVFESEKSVLQCFSYGIRNVVALGSGSVSKKQVQLLLQLRINKIILMHDTGYKFDSIQRNIDMIKGYSRMKEVQIGYWDNENKGYENKVSASDLGKDKLEYILENEIKFIEEGEDEERNKCD